MDDCTSCDGTGERDWLSGARCYECNGTGIAKDDDPCPDCRGTVPAQASAWRTRPVTKS